MSNLAIVNRSLRMLVVNLFWEKWKAKITVIGKTEKSIELVREYQNIPKQLGMQLVAAIPLCVHVKCRVVTSCYFFFL